MCVLTGLFLDIKRTSHRRGARQISFNGSWSFYTRIFPVKRVPRSMISPRSFLRLDPRIRWRVIGIPRGLVVFTPKCKVAYSALKTSLVFSVLWKGQEHQKATLPALCSQLEQLTEGLGRGSRGLCIRWVDVGQRRIKRAVPEVLADQEGISPLLNHEHRRRVLKYVRVL
jgi:hypothetical protein